MYAKDSLWVKMIDEAVDSAELKTAFSVAAPVELAFVSMPKVTRFIKMIAARSIWPLENRK